MDDYGEWRQNTLHMTELTASCHHDDVSQFKFRLKYYAMPQFALKRNSALLKYLAILICYNDYKQCNSRCVFILSHLLQDVWFGTRLSLAWYTL